MRWVLLKDRNDLTAEERAELDKLTRRMTGGGPMAGCIRITMRTTSPAPARATKVGSKAHHPFCPQPTYCDSLGAPNNAYASVRLV
jgi:hypothetical protein